MVHYAALSIPFIGSTDPVTTLHDLKSLIGKNYLQKHTQPSFLKCGYIISYCVAVVGFYIIHNLLYTVKYTCSHTHSLHSMYKK